MSIVASPFPYKTNRKKIKINLKITQQDWQLKHITILCVNIPINFWNGDNKSKICSITILQKVFYVKYFLRHGLFFYKELIRKYHPEMVFCCGFISRWQDPKPTRAQKVISRWKLPNFCKKSILAQKWFFCKIRPQRSRGAKHS